MRFFYLSVLFCCTLIAGAQHRQKDTLSIIGVGDIMLGTAYPKGYLTPDDGQNLLAPVAAILRNADITFGNHEGTLFDGAGMPKKCLDSTQCYAFKSPERYAQYLKQAGFDLMSVANNHSGDFGPQARAKTMQVLQMAGIASSGTVAKPYVLLEKEGVRYGLASFAPNRGTQDINDYKAVRAIVSLLDSLCDIVIVSFHGGAEGRSRQHVTRKSEIFLNENRGNVYEFARVAIDAGADVVFGHGPHVPRAVDLYKNRFIIYSLGNFATYGRFNLKGDAGIAPIMKVYVDRKGAFLQGEIIPVKQVGEGGPQIDEEGCVIGKIKELTIQDFPESELVISKKGAVTKNKNGIITKK